MGIDRLQLGSMVLLAAMAVTVAPAHAQSDGVARARPPAQAGGFAPAAASPGGSLRRIVRGLNAPAGGAVSGALRIDVELQVFGRAPALATLDDDGDVGSGAPVYGAPTHDEMLMAVTPVPFRSALAYRRGRPSMPLAR